MTMEKIDLNGQTLLLMLLGLSIPLRFSGLDFDLFGYVFPMLLLWQVVSALEYTSKYIRHPKWFQDELYRFWLVVVVYFILFAIIGIFKMHKIIPAMSTQYWIWASIGLSIFYFRIVNKKLRSGV